MSSTRLPSIPQLLFQYTSGASQYIDAFMFAMLHTITATICLHPIRSSAELPHSVNGIIFNVPYCGSCTKSRQIATEHDTAEREHRLLEEAQQPDGDRSKLRSARVRYNKAHLAYLKDIEQRAERYRNDHGVPPCGEATEGLTAPGSSVKDPTRRKPQKRVRFDGMNDHRPESEYRNQNQFDRTGSHYEPGLHADELGVGFFNTSDPYESDLSDEETDVLLGDNKHGEGIGNMECPFVKKDCEVEDVNDDETAAASDSSESEGLSREEILERKHVIQERIDQLLTARLRR